LNRRIPYKNTCRFELLDLKYIVQEPTMSIVFQRFTAFAGARLGIA
jgi:hypothetical protein